MPNEEKKVVLARKQTRAAKKQAAKLASAAANAASAVAGSAAATPAPMAKDSQTWLTAQLQAVTAQFDEKLARERGLRVEDQARYDEQLEQSQQSILTLERQMRQLQKERPLFLNLILRCILSAAFEQLQEDRKAGDEVNLTQASLDLLERQSAEWNKARAWVHASFVEELFRQLLHPLDRGDPSNLVLHELKIYGMKKLTASIDYAKTFGRVQWADE